MRRFLLALTLASLFACGDPPSTPTTPSVPTESRAHTATTNATDRAALVALYRATDGPNWTNSENWLTNEPIGEWYGVSVDGQGRTVTLWLPSNNLKGSIPSELGDLGSLRRLMLSGNPLAGRIPPELGRLRNLEELHLVDNSLTGPIPPELGDLGSLEYLGLSYNDLSGSIPPELGNLSSLRSLWLWDNDLSGLIPPELGNLGNLEWLSLGNIRLTGPIPPELGNLGNLVSLTFAQNELTGPIPPEISNLGNLESLTLSNSNLTGSIPSWLSNLSNLRHLNLRGNKLTGPIPVELGTLGNLESLYLSRNELSGSIPPELGELTSLWGLYLNGNQLTGPIPPEISNLGNLESLYLSRNELSGSIPPELGELTSLWGLYLYGNQLTGAIPPELGNLGGLRDLFLADNDLGGGLPRSLGGLRELRRLQLSNNVALSGELPRELVNLGLLESLQAAGTALCAPSDPDFQAWLEGVRTHRIASCAPGMPAYLTQAVQSRAFPVPLVAGEKALLRVFLTAKIQTNQGLPAVRARFYRNGRPSYVKYIPAGSHPIPTEVDEGDLSKSVNAEIPGRVIQPGLEMVLEIDPDTTLSPELGVPRRIPENGRLAVETQAVPLLDLTQIPFLWSTGPDSAIVDMVEAMAADPENHELLWDTRTLLPVGDLYITAHEPVTTSSNDAHDLISETRVIRTLEGGTGHYMGMMSGRVIGAAGVAYVGGRLSFSVPTASVMAHEFGHNFALLHAPCGGPDWTDPGFPYAAGSIGSWGYDFREGGSLVAPSTPDIMSYCRPEWVSDYHFTNALNFRFVDEHAASARVFPSPTRSLLLWGGTDTAGTLFLEPAFVVDAPPLVPQEGGDHRLVGKSVAGVELFALSFNMPETADADGYASFAFVLPSEDRWEDLASVTLSGPDGTITLNASTHRPSVIVRDPESGQVQRIMRDLPLEVITPEDAADLLSVPPHFTVRFSRGIPSRTAWLR